MSNQIWFADSIHFTLVPTLTYLICKRIKKEERTASAAAAAATMEWQVFPPKKWANVYNNGFQCNAKLCLLSFYRIIQSSILSLASIHFMQSFFPTFFSFLFFSLLLVLSSVTPCDDDSPDKFYSLSVALSPLFLFHYYFCYFRCSPVSFAAVASPFFQHFTHTHIPGERQSHTSI